MDLADAEHGVLVAALGDGPADAGGLEHVDRNQRGHHADRLAPADDARDTLLVQAVLQRHDVAVGRQVLLDQRRRPFGVVGLHRYEGDVDRLLARQVLHLGEMHGLGVLDRDLLLRRHAVELQPAAADGLDVFRPEVDQRHVLAGMGEPSTDISTQGARADDRNPLTHCFPLDLDFRTPHASRGAPARGRARHPRATSAGRRPAHRPWPGPWRHSRQRRHSVRRSTAADRHW